MAYTSRRRLIDDVLIEVYKQKTALQDDFILLLLMEIASRVNEITDSDYYPLPQFDD